MINLLSDESDDEQDGVPVHNPCCRHGLYVAQTKLAGPDGQRLPFKGLFTSQPLPIGAFVGLYTGEWYTAEQLESKPDVRRRNEYASPPPATRAATKLSARPPSGAGSMLQSTQRA